MATYQPRKGDRVQVTRTRLDGTIHFIKTGTILDAYGYNFKEDLYGRRSLAGSEDVAKMPGWTQTIEPLREA